MNRIRQLREEQKMTQSELAALMNTNYQTISDYEREKYYPNIGFLKLLAHRFNTSIDYLLCETDVRDPYMSAREQYLTPKETELVALFRKLDTNTQGRLIGVALGMAEAFIQSHGERRPDMQGSRHIAAKRENRYTDNEIAGCQESKTRSLILWL